MTNEEKQLLLADLCARLPHGVMVQYKDFEPIGLSEISLYDINRVYELKNCKPYLRPMSSMTEEEKSEFINCAGYEVEESINGRHYEYYLKDYVGTPEKPSCNCDAIDWLNARHFDFRGLIPKGLAIEALEGMYGEEEQK